MNQSNKNSTGLGATIDRSKVQNQSQVIEVSTISAKMAKFSHNSVGGKTSARPSRSIFKSKSLLKPMVRPKI